VQAFLTYAAGAVRVDAGRMMLNLGSRRLVAADDYRNTTNSYTGVRVDLGRSGARSATLFYSLPVRRRPGAAADVVDNAFAFDRESFDQRLWGGFAVQPRALGRAALDVAFVRFDERDAPGRPTRDRRLNNVNARLLAAPAPGRLDYEVEGIYQFGRTRSGLAAAAPVADVSAWFAHADIGYSFPGTAKARLSIEYDHASGDRPAGGFGRFDTLFGMRRPDFGPGGLYAQVGRGNIMTPGLRLEAAPSARLDVLAGYRAMWLASRTDAFSTLGVRDATGQSGRFAGHQVEARLRWWAVPARVRLEVNGAVLAKGRFLDEAPNAPRTANGRYVSTTAFLTF
jgi:Alginate export